MFGSRIVFEKQRICCCIGGTYEKLENYLVDGKSMWTWHLVILSNDDIATCSNNDGSIFIFFFFHSK